MYSITVYNVQYSITNTNLQIMNYLCLMLNCLRCRQCSDSDSDMDSDLRGTWFLARDPSSSSSESGEMSEGEK